MKILRLLGCLLAAALTAAGQTNIVGSGFVMGSTSGSSGGSGTVTSVGLTIGGFTVTGSPVINSGTLAAVLASPVANGIVVSDSSGNLSASTATMVSGNTLKFAGTSMIADDTTGALLLTPGTGKKTFLQGSNAGTNAETVNSSASGNSGLDFYNNSGVFQGTIGYGNASAASHAGQFFINAITGSAIHFSVNTSDVSVLSVAAASTPIALYNGTWFVSGGTGTTTWPALLVQPSGTTTTTWNTAGTGIGVNSVNGFTGYLLDLQANGVSKAHIDSAGTASFGGTVTSPGFIGSPNNASGPTYVFTGAPTTGTYWASPGIGFSVAATSVGTWTASSLSFFGTASVSSSGNFAANNATLQNALTVNNSAYSLGAPSNNQASGIYLPAQTITLTGTSGVTNFGSVTLGIPTYTNTSSNTITNLATLSIVGAPATLGSQIGTNKYAIDVLAGAIATPAVILGTAAPTNGIGTWEFGVNRTGSALVISTTNGLQVNVGGTTYTLAVLSTNP